MDLTEVGYEVGRWTELVQVVSNGKLSRLRFWRLGQEPTSPHRKIEFLTKCNTEPGTWRELVNTVMNLRVI